MWLSAYAPSATGRLKAELRTSRLRGLGAGLAVTELAESLIQVLDAQRFLQDGDGAELEDVIEHLAVGIAGDDHDRQIGIDLLGVLVDFVAGDVGQLEIEEAEIELLLLESGHRFLAG